MSAEHCGPIAVGSPRRWVAAVLVWVAALLVTPAADVAGRPEPVLRILALAAVAVAAVVPLVMALTGRGRSVWVPLLASALVPLAIATSDRFGPPWYGVWVLVAATAGSLLSGRAGLAAVVGIPVLAAVTLAASGATSDQVWTAAFTAFLAGALDLALVRLLATIGRLRQAQVELVEQAVRTERERFSRDLHDLLGHTLSLVVVKAEAVRRLIPRDPEAAAGHARDIERIGREALEEVREAVDGYRRTSVAVEVARARVALDVAGVGFEVAVDDAALTAQADEAFAWVVREGVTNVVRHSAARRCRLRIAAQPGGVILELEDDGPAGDDRGLPARAGSGLAGLRSRLVPLGGDVQGNRSEGGFRLVARLPASLADREPGAASLVGPG
jgi:two-component system sensor histidine kinase DesK